MWECFRDARCHPLWAVRNTDNKGFNSTIHVVTPEEAQFLVDKLNERDDLRLKLSRIESIATVGREHSLLFGKTYAAIGFDKIIKECE